MSYNPIVATGELSDKDPWNWKMPSRASLMSLSKISDTKDLQRAKTAQSMRPKRNFTANLHTDDIKGAKPKIFAPAQVNKPEFYNNNSDILGSKPRTLHVGLNNPYGSL